MEFRDTLLQNELEHLGKNFRLLSAELLLIQDFIKEEFGSKFLAFSNARREQRCPPYSKGSMKSYTSSSRKRRAMVGAATEYGQAIRGEEDSQELFGVQEPCIIPDGLQGSEIDNTDDSEGSEEMEYDPMGLVQVETEDSSDVEVESKHNIITVPSTEKSLEEILTGTETADKVRKGRPKSIIHKYYEKVKAEDGKWKDKCYTCGNFVSSKAPRLKKHLLKCRGKDSKVMQIITKLEARKQAPSTHYPKVMQIINNLEVPTTSSTGNNRLGRKTDIVRLAFQDMQDSSGYNKMKCMNCGELVSNKASRMRNHLIRCTGESKKPIDIGGGHPSKPSTNAVNQSEENSSNSGSESEEKFHKSSVPLLSTSKMTVLPPEGEHDLPSQTEHLPGSQYVPEGSLYPSSSNHGWAPADQMGNFTSGPLIYDLPPPPSTSSYQNH